MSVELLAHYRVTCDACSRKKIDLNAYGRSYQWGEVVTALRECGWHVEFVRTICPDCRSFDESLRGM